MQNWNEKYLLKFISTPEIVSQSKDNLLNVILKLGIKLHFDNYNSVYQIIDELNFEDYKKKFGLKNEKELQ